MKLTSLTRSSIIIVVTIIIIYLYWTGLNFRQTDIILVEKSIENEQAAKRNMEVVLVVVVCGDRLHESLNMLKSAIMFTKAKLKIYVITEDNIMENFNEKLSEWREITNYKFEFSVMPLEFPTVATEEWRKLFKPCASQRLFLPNVLNETDAILYVDADTLFLTPVEEVWNHFKFMNSSQMAALAPEHEDPNIAWYNRFAKHPYYGKLGVNTGVMLMNLTRMRDFQWVDYVIPIYKKYKLKITWGDQDIVNIIFHFHPDKLYIYSCKYNFRPDHCMYMSICKPAEKEGVSVIHGSRGFFHSEKQPVFQIIYRTFEEFQLGGDINKEFLQPLETYLDLTVETNCGRVKEIFIKNIRRYIDDDTEV